MSRNPLDPNAPQSRIFTRRGLLLTGAQLGFAGLLFGRMRHLQIEQGERYRDLAEENRINIRLLPPARGLIFDRNGTPLALNRHNFRIVIVRELAGDVEMRLAQLAQLIPLSAERQQRIIKDVRSRPAFVPVTVAEHLTREEFNRVAANTPALPGISPEVGASRFYPRSEEFAHIVGYVGPVSDWDLKQIQDPEPILQIPDFQIGKSGVEKRIEDDLRGEAGASRIEVNAVGRVIRELDRVEGRAGDDLQLTLDQGLQQYALHRLQGQSASAVVLDTKTGEILALASSPSFDPNKFVFGISVKDWNALLEDPYRPLYNKSVSGEYPPGSTFKMIVALAAIEAGVIDASERVFCGGSIEFGNRRFHCWRRGGHGNMNLRDSLKHSCDVYYYEVAHRVGIEKITEMAKRLGLGGKFDLPLPAIRAGLTPTKGWKQAVYGQAWLDGDTLNAGIGQGFVLATPLQLAVMTARIATGLAIEPRLTTPRAGAEAPAPEPIGLSQSTLAQARRGMYAVTNERNGTAYASRSVAEGNLIAGKTGTSQVRRITEAERRAGVTRNEDLPWERRDHALFTAFAPYDNPRFAISVVVEHGGGGSSAAAPIAQDVLLHALYGGPPPMTAYPPEQRAQKEAEWAKAPRPARRSDNRGQA